MRKVSKSNVSHARRVGVLDCSARASAETYTKIHPEILISMAAAFKTRLLAWLARPGSRDLICFALAFICLGISRSLGIEAVIRPWL